MRSTITRAEEFKISKMLEESLVVENGSAFYKNSKMTDQTVASAIGGNVTRQHVRFLRVEVFGPMPKPTVSAAVPNDDATIMKVALDRTNTVLSRLRADHDVLHERHNALREDFLKLRSEMRNLVERLGG